MKLVKEIISKHGEVHFRRYLLFKTPWFFCYLHKIYKADEDLHLHNHPWKFWGIVLWGGYEEQLPEGVNQRGWLSCGGGDNSSFHKIKYLFKNPTITLFFTGVKTYDWGYMTSEGVINHEVYRARKNENNLPL